MGSPSRAPTKPALRIPLGPGPATRRARAPSFNPGPAAQGLALHAAFKLSFILEVLQRRGLVTAEVGAAVTAFIAANQTFAPPAAAAVPEPVAAAPSPPAVPARSAVTTSPLQREIAPWGHRAQLARAVLRGQ